MPDEEEIFDPKEHCRLLDNVRANAPPLEPLWGYFLFKKAITSVIGDPGICKTTFGYGLGMALCKGLPFLDVSAEESIKVLYMDFESADPLVASRASIISSEPTPNFFVYNIVDYPLNKIATGIIQFCTETGINLIIIDNQSMAFATRDENDNAEAIKQMKYIRSVTNACNSATIIFHHTSKANLPGTRKGSGAFARARLADIAVNLEAVDEEDRDWIKLETVKNRLVDEQVLWYLRKKEGQFVFTEPPLGKVQTSTQIYKAQKSIVDYMKLGIDYKYNNLEFTLSGNGIDSFALQNAVRKLLQQGRIARTKYGYYQKR